MTSYSQRGEDLWIKENLDLPTSDGVFVDVGCAHPTINSNTYLFEQQGWTGLAIDGNPRWAREWNTTRPDSAYINSVVSDKEGEVFYENHAIDEISGIINTASLTAVKKRSTTLETLLKLHYVGQIDLLSVDVEGYEYQVLKGLDFKRHDPTCLIIEFCTLSKYNFQAIDYVIKEKGYRIRHLTEFNFILTK